MDTPKTDPASEFTRNRFRENHRSFATAELLAEQVETIHNSRIDARHAPLDKLLNPK